MDPLNNPFSPGAGSPPPELAGRDELLSQARVTLGRIKSGRFEPSQMLVGLRGVGKTVLLNRIRELAEADGYGVVIVEATESRSLPELVLPALRQILFQFDAMEGLSNKVKRGLRVLRSFIGAVKVKLGDMELGLDKFRYPNVGALAPDDARAALRDPVEEQGLHFTDEALDELVRVTHGCPYFRQEWGYQAWNPASGSPIDLNVVRRTTDVAIQKLDESFFRVRFDRLTPREKDYMRALADLGPGPHRSGDIAECLGVKVQSIAPLRSGLIRKGMIYSPAHGDTAFTVPMFDKFMLRTMPGWVRADGRAGTCRP